MASICSFSKWYSLETIFKFNISDDDLNYLNCFYTLAPYDKLNAKISDSVQFNIVYNLTVVDKDIDSGYNFVKMN